MMNSSRRQVFPSNKRKQIDDGPSILKKPSTVTTKTLAKPSLHLSAPAKRIEQPISKNPILAGYLAHEFLTKGTLFGQAWDPDRAGAGTEAEALPLSAASIIQRSQKIESEPQGKADKKEESHQRYTEVAHLLKSDGAHIPGYSTRPNSVGSYNRAGPASMPLLIVV